MADRVIASRPTLEQVTAIVDFMEEHPDLAQGKLRGLDGRDQSKQLWVQLAKIVNNLQGPTRPVKSWIKFWADKKSAVRAKVQAGDSNNLSSNIEKRIYDLFIANTRCYNDSKPNKHRNSVKQETFLEEGFFDDSMEQNHLTDVEPEQVVAYEEPMMNLEERHMAVFEKLVKVMSDQATAITQMAHASHANTQAIERMAEASHIQARALDRLATTFESISAATHDVRNSIVDIDTTVKRLYSTSPT